MNCSNCGTFNQEGSKFCIKCGQNLISSADNNVTPIETNDVIETPALNNNVSETNIQNTNVVETQTNSTQYNYSQNGSTTNNTTNQVDAKISFMGYFFMIIAIILKPFTSLKEELNKFNGFKNSAVLSLIVSGTATIINLLSTMWSAVRVKEFSWTTGNYTTSWVWDNLKNIKYVEVIGKNFLIYLGAIVAIALVYYLGSLIVKKQTNFSRLLGISALAVTPLLICSLILSPLLSLIWAELAMPIIVIGAIYTIVIIYEGINSEILLEGNAKYYFNLVCLSILGIAAYYLCMKVFMSSITGGLDGLDDLMNMFG